MKRLFLSVLFILASLSMAVALEDTLEFNRKVMVFYVDEGAIAGTTTSRILLYESLLINVAKSSDSIGVFEFDGLFIPGSDEERNSAASQAGCDAWVSVKVSGNTDNFQAEISSFDILKNELVFTFTEERTEAIEFRDAERRFWRQLQTALAEAYPPIIYDTAETVIVQGDGTVTMTAVPGTQVSGIFEDEFEVPESGKVTLRLPKPASYVYTARHGEHFISSGAFFLNRDEMIVEVKQNPKMGLIVDTSLRTAQYLGSSIGFFPVKDFVFLRFGFTTYLFGVYFPDSDNSNSTEAEQSYIISEPLTNIGVAAGYYYNSPEEIVRFYNGIGFFFRLVHSFEYIGIEPISPWGMNLFAGAEYAPFPQMHFFFEWSPTFYYMDDPQLFFSIQSYYRADNLDNDEPLVNFNIEWGSFFLGVRFYI